MPTLADADCLRPRAKTQKDEKRGTLLNVIVGPEVVEGLQTLRAIKVYIGGIGLVSKYAKIWEG